MSDVVFWASESVGCALIVWCWVVYVRIATRNGEEQSDG